VGLREGEEDLVVEVDDRWRGEEHGTVDHRRLVVAWRSG
jgi:hypothetical protein